MGFHLHHCQHTKLYAGTWNKFICQWKRLKVVLCIMPAVCLFVVAVQVDILVTELKNNDAHIAGIYRRPNKFIGFDT